MSSSNSMSGSSFIATLLRFCLIAPASSFGSRGIFGQPFEWDTEPFRGVFSLLKYSDPDWGVLSDYGMQLTIMDDRGVRRQNRRFHRRTIVHTEDSMERNLNYVLEIQLDLDRLTRGV